VVEFQGVFLCVKYENDPASPNRMKGVAGSECQLYILSIIYKVDVIRVRSLSS